MLASEWIRRHGRFTRTISAGVLRSRLKRQKGECTWCGKKVKPPRQTWCSDLCVHCFRERSDPGYIRGILEERDGEICSICGHDVGQLARLVEKIKDARVTNMPHGRYIGGRYHRNRPGRRNRTRTERYQAIGRHSHEWGSFRGGPIWYWLKALGGNDRTKWEADHIIPISEGGGLCRPGNIRTVCLRCHKAETKKLAGRRRKTVKN